MTSPPVADRPPTAARGVAVAFLAAVLVAPLFAHGCHGPDDLDDEPAVVVERDPQER